MADYLLIHGAWHGKWCWERTIADLTAAGHRARAIDLPAQGDDRTDPADVGLDTWIDRVIDELDTYQKPPILVGHSMGGMVITGVAGAVPELISRVVYVCAFLPEDGESLFDLASRPENAGTAVVNEPMPDGVCVMIPAEAARVAFYGLCEPAAAEAALPRLRALPMRTVTEPVRLRHVPPPVPRTYIECTEDRAMPIALQRYMAGRSPGIAVHTLHTDHSPFLSADRELVGILVSDDLRGDH